MAGVLERIKRRTADRNFNNDVVSILDNLRRYKLEDAPIDVGNSTFDGAILEFLLAAVAEMEVLDDEVRLLRTTVAELKAKGCKCDDTAKEAVESKDKQLTVDGTEVNHLATEESKPKRKGK